MLIHGKQFAFLEESDLQSLVEDKIPEGKNIEYKRVLPNNSDRDKKEFLSDISSFSNTAGGYIFFGISEENGIPVDINGLGDINPDEQKLRIENLLRDSIAPRLPGVSIRAINIVDRGYVLAMHIPKSWVSPHMVTYDGNSKFFSRNSAGKYPLDVFELRTAFNSTNLEGEYLRAFRTDRIGKIISNETPVTLKPNPKVILHLIPISSFMSGIKYDLREFQIGPDSHNLAPISTQFATNLRFNFDGLLTFHKEIQHYPAVSYLQLYRNGMIESVDTKIFNSTSNPPLISSHYLEQEIIMAVKRFLLIQNKLEIEPPYFILLTLAGVQGYYLTARAEVGGYYANPIDRNDLLVPEILVEDISLPVATILKPAFDAIWNAAGQPQSPFYDTEGNWKPTV